MTALQTCTRIGQSLTLVGVILGSAAVMQPIDGHSIDSALVAAVAPQSASAAQPTPPDNGGPSRTQGTGTR
ncbi:MAG: hypothetical protein BJG00_001180 [Limnothrix sp. CACIAM 69d]|jgi:hypothetical protein|nr:MAG: hypothetical protein BJG00_001180 [Limnothrix sp. CACIAM 69d]